MSYALGGLAAVLVAATWIYIVLGWRRAPKAVRALRLTAGANLAAGVLIGVLLSRYAPEVARSESIRALGFGTADECSPDGVTAIALGKAIVLEDQRQAGNPNWVSVAQDAELCRQGSLLRDSLLCKGAFLGRHALGLDSNLGDNRKCIPYQQVAELCGNAFLPKESEFCKRAFDFQRRKMGR